MPAIILPIDNPQGIADEIVRTFQEFSQQWANQVFPYARSFFGLLASIQFVWFFLRWALDRDDLTVLFISFIRLIFTTFFFVLVLTYGPNWLSLFIQSMQQIAQEVSGLQAVSPSGLLAQGAQLALKMVSRVNGWGFLDDVGLSLLTVFSALVTMGGFIVMSGMMLITQVEIALIMGPGVIMLGFGASSWTSQMVRGYIDYAIGAGVKLFTIIMIASIATKIGDQLGQAVDNSTTQNSDLYFYIFGVTSIFGWLTLRVPQVAAGIISGGVSLSFMDLYGSILRGVANAYGAASVATGVAGAAVAATGALAGGAASGVFNYAEGSNQLRKAVTEYDNAANTSRTATDEPLKSGKEIVREIKSERPGVKDYLYNKLSRPTKKKSLADEVQRRTRELKQHMLQKEQSHL